MTYATKPLLALALSLALSGCAYNDPARFMGRLDAATLATIGEPIRSARPNGPSLRGPDYGTAYVSPASGPAHGAWGPK